MWIALIYIIIDEILLPVERHLDVIQDIIDQDLIYLIQKQYDYQSLTVQHPIGYQTRDRLKKPQWMSNNVFAPLNYLQYNGANFLSKGCPFVCCSNCSLFFLNFLHNWRYSIELYLKVKEKDGNYIIVFMC